jgi:hypothetical protein
MKYDEKYWEKKSSVRLSVAKRLIAMLSKSKEIGSPDLKFLKETIAITYSGIHHLILNQMRQNKNIVYGRFLIKNEMRDGLMKLLDDKEKKFECQK